VARARFRLTGREQARSLTVGFALGSSPDLTIASKPRVSAAAAVRGGGRRPPCDGRSQCVWRRPSGDSVPDAQWKLSGLRQSTSLGIAAEFDDHAERYL